MKQAPIIMKAQPVRPRLFATACHLQNRSEDFPAYIFNIVLSCRDSIGIKKQ